MRRCVLALIVLVAGCGELTDGELGRCAESTPEWWPLRPGIRWVYEEIDFHSDPPQHTKDLSVQAGRAPILGLAGDQKGFRTWRGDYDGTGWRWFIDEDSAFSFRRDVWMQAEDGEPVDPRPPCTVAADEDVRSCLQAAPASENYYLPSKKRLDYRPDRVCERSAWRDSHVKWTIEIGSDEAAGECPLDRWRSDPAACVGTASDSTEEEWSVVSIAERIEVPAGAFDDCLCVRRAVDDPADPQDKTFCFARGIGKVYELDKGNAVECLSEYCVDDADCEPDGVPDGDPAYPCEVRTFDR